VSSARPGSFDSRLLADAVARVVDMMVLLLG
jgi:hypothetical protein